LPAYRVHVTAVGFEANAAQDLANEILDVPHATDDDVARLVVSPDVARDEADAIVLLLAKGEASDLPSSDKPIFIADRDHDPDRARDRDHDPDRARDPEEDAPPEKARRFPIGPRGKGIDRLRAALLEEALAHLGVPIARARRAKRPYAI